jgi:hypothetical protein
LVRLQKSVDSVVAAARWMMMMLGAVQLANGFSGIGFVDMTGYDIIIWPQACQRTLITKTVRNALKMRLHLRQSPSLNLVK